MRKSILTIYLAALITVILPNSYSAPVSLELGRVQTEFFNTTELGYHQQNWWIASTQQGHIVVANTDNLLLYDGIKWNKLSSHENAFFYSAAISTEGRIYSALDDKLGYFQGSQDGSWQFIDIANNKPPPKFDYIYHILIVKDRVYFLSLRYLFVYDTNKGLRWLERKEADLYKLWAIDEQLYVASGTNGLSTFDPATLTLTHIKNLKNLSGSLVDGFRDRNNRFIVVTSKGIYQKLANHFARFDQGLESWLNNNDIKSVLVLASGNIVLGSRNNGLAIVNDKGEALRFITQSQGLEESWISELAVDFRGDIWTSHGSSGISRIQVDDFTFFNDKLGVEKIEAITRYAEHLFVGSLTKGLLTLDQPSSLMDQAKFRKIGQVTGVWSLLSSDEFLLVGHSPGLSKVTNDNGQFRINTITDKGVVRQMTQPAHAPNYVYGIMDWTVFRYSPNDDHFSLLNQSINNIIYLIEGISDDLWVTTLNSQVYHVTHLSDWPNVRIKKLANIALDQSSNRIQYLGKTLVLANTNGQFTMNQAGEFSDYANAKPWPIDEKQLFYRAIDGAGCDKWTTDSQSIFHFQCNNNQNFQIHQHLHSSQLNLPIQAIHRDPEGTLWIGGIDKLIRVDKNYSAIKNTIIPPHINSIFNPQESVYYYGSGLFNKAIAAIDVLPQHSNLRIEFGTSHYREKDETRYRYRIKPFMEQWSPWSDDQHVEFRKLPAGRFDFELQSQNGRSQLATANTIKINRHPLWRETWLAKVSVIILLIMTIALLFRIMMRRRLIQFARQAEQLEQKVKDRTFTIEQQKQQLIEQNNAKTQFFANVSHEFRTPLTLIMGPLTNIMRGEIDVKSEELKTHINLALQNTHRMMSLLSEILDLNQLEAGQKHLLWSNGDLRKVIQHVVQRLQVQSSQKQIDLKTHGLGNDLNLFFDVNALEKIIINILSNAIKFSPPKSQVSLSATQNQRYIELEISDNGPGIAVAEQDKVFERYYQSKDHHNPIHPGTGIGLALVKELVELHSGTIHLHSERNKGSTFTIRLLKGVDHIDPDNLRQNDAINVEEMLAKRDFGNADEPLGSANHQDNAQEKDHKSDDQKTILIIDDNDELREFIRMQLSINYYVIEANNGVEGLEKIRQALPDIVICDVMMPKMDGFSLSETMKNDENINYIPLILLTARTTQEDKLKGLAKGADDYLCKPFDSAELLLRISNVIAQQQRLRNKLANAIEEPTKTTNPKRLQFENKLASTIEQHINDPSLNVQTLANLMAMDRSTLVRKIKQTHQCTAVQLIRTQRLSIAMNLLKEKQGSVSEVAYAVGFESLNYFSRCFRQHYQISPSRIGRQET